MGDPIMRGWYDTAVSVYMDDLLQWVAEAKERKVKPPDIRGKSDEALKKRRSFITQMTNFFSVGFYKCARELQAGYLDWAMQYSDRVDKTDFSPVPSLGPWLGKNYYGHTREQCDEMASE